MSPSNGALKLLNALVEASQLLNSTLNLKKILSILLELATKNLDAERGTIYLLDREKRELWSQVLKGDKAMEIRLPLGKGIAGAVAKSGKTINVMDAYADPRFDRGFDERSGYRTTTMLCMPMRDRKEKIVGVFQILNKRKRGFTKWDERFLAAISIPASIAIENARLHLAEIENQRVEKELEVAGRIQQQLLPRELPQSAGYELSALTIPCHTVGGDYYNATKIDETRVVLTIADVSGKGIPAALLVSSLHAALHISLESGLTPVEVVSKLNQYIYNNSTSEKFITLLLAMYDSATRTLSYVNAGHCYPYIRCADGTVTTLTEGSYCLGILPSVAYKEGTVQLAPSDTLVLYTDGVTEAMNRREELFGEERLETVLREGAGLSASDIQSNILAKVNAFSKGVAQSDDVTMMVLKVAGAR